MRQFKRYEIYVINITLTVYRQGCFLSLYLKIFKKINPCILCWWCEWEIRNENAFLFPPYPHTHIHTRWRIELNNGNLWIPPLFPNSLTALSGVGALQVNIPKDIYEFARGDNITLPCTFVPNGQPRQATITWTLEGLQANSKEVGLLPCVLLDVSVFVIMNSRDNHCTSLFATLKDKMFLWCSSFLTESDPYSLLSYCAYWHRTAIWSPGFPGCGRCKGKSQPQNLLHISSGQQSVWVPCPDPRRRRGQAGWHSPFGGFRWHLKIFIFLFPFSDIILILYWPAMSVSLPCRSI